MIIKVSNTTEKKISHSYSQCTVFPYDNDIKIYSVLKWLFQVVGFLSFQVFLIFLVLRISGGWLLVYNVVIDGTSTPPTTLGVERSYRGINHYKNNNMVLATGALKELRTHLSFTQLRFYCNKRLGRTFHVATITNSSGTAVVQYFSRQTDAKPYTCGSFARLSGDNSFLAGDCANWGLDLASTTYNVGKWGHDKVPKLYKYPAFILNLHHWATFPQGKRWECDDFNNNVSSGDFWKIYVR